MNQQEKSNGEKKFFPNISLEEQETFEFGCSQSLEDSPNSPADHLFFNGKLQPHVFPSPHLQKNPNPNPTTLVYNISRSSSSSRSTSRNIRSGMEYYNNSVLSSSRSNSSNSSSGSARTSVSESLSSSRKVASTGGGGGERRRKSTSSLSKEECSFWKQYYHHQAKKPVALAPDFGSSLRWQFITPVPDLKSQSARRSTRVHNVELETLRLRSGKENGNEAGAWFGLKMLRLLATACLSCHSIRPASADQ